MSDDKKELDINSLSEADRKFFQQFGRLPPKDRKAPARMPNQGKKHYFDSGEYFSTKGGGSTGAGAAPNRGNALLNKAANHKGGIHIQVKDGKGEEGAEGDAEDGGAQ